MVDVRPGQAECHRIHRNERALAVYDGPWLRDKAGALALALLTAALAAGGTGDEQAFAESELREELVARLRDELDAR